MARHALPLWPAAHPGAPPCSPDGRSLDVLTTRRVREMLSWRGGFDASSVTVEVREGTAVLSGTVASGRDAEEARRLAISVWGVRDVEDHLRVQQPIDSAPLPFRA